MRITVQAAGGQALLLSRVAASRYTAYRDQTDNEFFANAFGVILEMLERPDASDKDQDAFWRDHVLPYFREADAEGHLEAMAWEIRRSLNDPEIDRWTEDHAEQVAKFRDWSKGWRAVPRR
jgi:hypothetical protein